MAVPNATASIRLFPYAMRRTALGTQHAGFQQQTDIVRHAATITAQCLTTLNHAEGVERLMSCTTAMSTRQTTVLGSGVNVLLMDFLVFRPGGFQSSVRANISGSVRASLTIRAPTSVSAR